MKKIWMSLLALTLVLSLIGCGSQTAQSEASRPAAEKPAENTAQEEANGAEDKPQTGTIAWHYVLTTDKRTEEKKNAEGVLLAETRYELPKLEAICDGGDASQTPPEAQRRVCEVFNSRVAELSKSLTTVEKLAESAQEQYTEMSEEYRKSFGSYTEELRVSESRQRGDLLEVSFQTYGYWGGAHGGSSFFSWHYDLADGKFIELADLSDQPDKLNQMVANEIISSIENGADTDEYVEDYAEIIRAKEGFEVSFGADAMTVIFSQYEIASYAFGIPTFEISYDKLAPLLNERGRRLLGTDETGVSEPDIAPTPAPDTSVSEQVPPFTISSDGVTVDPYCTLWYEKTWTENGWLIKGDPDNPTPAISQEDYDKIPTVTLADDFKVQYDHPQSYLCSIYDEQFRPLRSSWYGNTGVCWLEPGTYYCVIPAWGPQGRYIESEVAYEEILYHCICRLVVPDGGAKPYTPEKAAEKAGGLAEARLHINDKDIILNDTDSLAKLEDWLKNAEFLAGSAGCPFGSILTLTYTDGSMVSCCPAEDSCGVVFANGTYYRYAHDNKDFWALFGIDLFGMP
jgi:hypothetical protein